MQNNLHGDQKLAQAKQNAADTINGLTHLNEAQREAIINQIQTQQLVNK